MPAKRRTSIKPQWASMNAGTVVDAASKVSSIGLRADAAFMSRDSGAAMARACRSKIEAGLQRRNKSNC